MRRFIPSAVTALRLAAAPAFFIALGTGARLAAAAALALAALTDVLDGFLAHRLGSASDSGAYFDVIADFIFIVAAFGAFVRVGWYPWIVLVPIAASFACFALSSGRERPVYDPVGKRMGAFLMASIALSLVFPDPILRLSATIAIFSYCAASLSFRLAHAFKRVRGPADR